MQTIPAQMKKQSIQEQIEAELAQLEPSVEVLLVELSGGRTLRIFIDSPDGVSLELCERVSRHLNEWRNRYALEVSSPGLQRPLTRPDHYTKFVGKRVKVRMSLAQADQRSFTGQLLGATDDEITLATEDGVVTLSFADIQRSNLMED